METVQITLSAGQMDAAAVIGAMFSFVLGWSIFGWAR